MSEASRMVTYDVKFNELPVPVRKGYFFAGWYDANDNHITGDAICKLTSAQSLTARWIESVSQNNQYGDGYWRDGGSGYWDSALQIRVSGIGQLSYEYKFSDGGATFNVYVDDVLYERIKLRVDLMFQQGLKEEFISLLEKGFTKETPGMKAIGYSEFFNYFSEGDSIEEIKRKIDFHLDEIIYDIKHHSCKYAKKQYTYIRDIPDSIKVDFKAEKEDLTKIKELIQKFISTIDHKINL